MFVFLQVAGTDFEKFSRFPSSNLEQEGFKISIKFLGYGFATCVFIFHCCLGFYCCRKILKFFFRGHSFSLLPYPLQFLSFHASSSSLTFAVPFHAAISFLPAVHHRPHAALSLCIYICHSYSCVHSLASFLICIHHSPFSSQQICHQSFSTLPAAKHANKYWNSWLPALVASCC